MIIAILIDAMFTVFTPRKGLNRYGIMKELIRRLLGRDVDIKELERVYKEQRALWEERLPARHSEKWAIIDREIILKLFADISFEDATRAGTAISDEILFNPEFYEVINETIDFLQEAKRRNVGVIVTSNQDIPKLRHLVEQFGLLDLLRNMYASTEVGYEKPDPRFFEAVLAGEGLDASECAMIGNNPKNDMEGCSRVGIAGILYDMHNEYPDFKGHKVSRLNEIWDLDIKWKTA